MLIDPFERFLPDEAPRVIPEMAEIATMLNPKLLRKLILRDRQDDRAARKALGRPRASSVFPAPARAVLDLDARTFQEANEFSKETVGKGITQQTFSILPKIKEFDALLRSSANARDLIREVHPELCCWALNCEKSMRFNKSNPAGFRERLDVVKGLKPSAATEVRPMRR